MQGGDYMDDRRRANRKSLHPQSGWKTATTGNSGAADRVQQARVANALEPEWEARFEPRSYGFRPGRGCHDAIEAIYVTLKGRTSKRQWVLDADLSAAFDRIKHDRLLTHLGSFPAREMIAQWLAAGVVERGRFAPTKEGTPQGGVISPMLLNIALHGIEEAAGVRYLRCGPQGAHTKAGSPVLVRYADDFVVMCHSREQAEQAWHRLGPWLAPRGLAFNEEKTHVVRVEQGFDFLGFNVRRYGGGKLLIKPSTAAVQRIRERIAAEVYSLRGANTEAVIGGSTRSFEVGPPTTGAGYQRRCSQRWITTSGGISTDGRCAPIRTSRDTGSLTCISVGSTRPEATSGCSATAKAAARCASSLGQRSSVTTWSGAHRLWTIPLLPSTGPEGNARCIR